MPHLAFALAVEAVDFVELFVELVKVRALDRAQLQEQVHEGYRMPQIETGPSLLDAR